MPKFDFNTDDDDAIRSVAARNAQNALKLARTKAKAFDQEKNVSLGDVDIDGDDMNFTNPTGLGETTLP